MGQVTRSALELCLASGRSEALAVIAGNSPSTIHATNLAMKTEPRSSCLDGTTVAQRSGESSAARTLLSAASLVRLRFKDWPQSRLTETAEQE